MYESGERSLDYVAPRKSLGGLQSWDCVSIASRYRAFLYMDINIRVLALVEEVEESVEA